MEPNFPLSNDLSADELSIFVEGMMLRHYDYDEYITVTDEDKDDSEIS